MTTAVMGVTDACDDNFCYGVNRWFRRKLLVQDLQTPLTITSGDGLTGAMAPEFLLNVRVQNALMSDEYQC